MAMKEARTIIVKNKIKEFEKKSFLISVMHRFFMFLSVRVPGPEKAIEIKYRSRIGRNLNLDHPMTFNEKIQWLKMYYYKDYYRQSSDKYLIRQYLRHKIGKDLEPELLYVTRNIKDISLSRISRFPCIMKISNGCGQNLIIRDRNEYSEAALRKKVKKMIYEANTHARYGCEPQYLKNRPYIIFEELLETAEGKLPNDYKLFYFNGKLQFVYCSVDRLGLNVRHLYDDKWNRINGLLLENATKEKYRKHMETQSIPMPGSFEEMKKIGSIIAKDYPLVRIDFFDVDGVAYVGEITLHHGSGHDRFYPESLDLYYGQKLVLPPKNYRLKI